MSTLPIIILLQIYRLFTVSQAIPNVGTTQPDCSPCICVNIYANCSYRNLTDVPQNLPVTIKSLDLTGNNLSSLGPGRFQNYSALRHLYITNNALILKEGVYHNDAFFGLQKLLLLDLSGNCNTYFNDVIQYDYPDAALSRLKSLKKLCIDGLPSVYFGPGFRNMTHLKILKFKGFCNLLNVHLEMFVHTPYLRIVNMSNCGLYTIHTDTFSHLKFMTTLDLSSNWDLGFKNASLALKGLRYTRIKTLILNEIVPRYAFGIVIEGKYMKHLRHTNISRLFLDHNWISFCKPDIFDYYPKTLKFLSVKDNRFLPGEFIYNQKKMVGLEHIDIGDMTIVHNWFHSQKGSVTNSKYAIQGPPNLKHISARNYQMGTAIRQLNFNVTQILSVDLSQNVIPEWIGPVNYFSSLKKLDLSKTFCSKVGPKFFPSFPNLEILNISYNLIGVDYDYSIKLFHNLVSLKTLDFSANVLNSLDQDVFLQNTKLQHLNLSHNELSEMTVRISHIRDLQSLDLSRNNIQTLHSDFRSALDSIPHIQIDLSGNPLQCTCENIHFFIWLIETKVKLNNNDSYNCSNDNGDTIIWNEDVSRSLKTKCKNVFVMILASVSLIASCLTVIIIGIVYRYRWKIKYLYYVARDRYRPVTDHGLEQRYFEYDAFVSFADEDLEFVNKLVEYLEDQGRRLCIHHRDFRPGEPIAANVVKAVQRSRRTVIILSRHFVSSQWCKYEFEMAKMESVHEERKVILVVKIQDLETGQIPREIMYMMRTDSYSEFPVSAEDQRSFWANLNSTLSS